MMKPILCGVMAYEDVAVAKIAKEKWDYLAHTLKDGFDFDLRLWKFDILQIPELRDAAVNDATQAQLVFVATRGAGNLPSQVKEWIEEWLVLNGRAPHTTRLLSAVFDPSSNGPGASPFSQFAYLQQAARRGSMDFIASGTPAQNQQSAIRLHASTAATPSWGYKSQRRDHTPKPKLTL
jgi:hypothetical protein